MIRQSSHPGQRSPLNNQLEHLEVERSHIDSAELGQSQRLQVVIVRDCDQIERRDAEFLTQSLDRGCGIHVISDRLEAINRSCELDLGVRIGRHFRGSFPSESSQWVLFPSLSPAHVEELASQATTIAGGDGLRHVIVERHRLVIGAFDADDGTFRRVIRGPVNEIPRDGFESRFRVGEFFPFESCREHSRWQSLLGIGVENGDSSHDPGEVSQRQAGAVISRLAIKYSIDASHRLFITLLRRLGWNLDQQRRLVQLAQQTRNLLGVISCGA